MTDDVLKGPDYFKCEKFNGTLKKIECVKRQEGNAERYEFKLSLENCKECEQGRKIRKEVLAKCKPRRGTGERIIECFFYSHCLDRAAKRDFKSFHCERCPYNEKAEPMSIKKENTRICEECGKRKTMTPSCPYCPQCMAARSKKASSKKKGKHLNRSDNRKKADKRDFQKTAAQDMDRAEKSSPRGDLEAVLRFEKYARFFSAIERLTEEEMGPVDFEIIIRSKGSFKKSDGERL